MIYFALRDHNWNTMNHQVENEDITVDDDRFTISYDCIHVDGGVPVMTWKARISGHADGSIVFEINGKAIEDFRRNRAGFCILHSLDTTGSECHLIHPDGSRSTRVFPEDVAPDNPFKLVQSMSWATAGNTFTLEFEGDVFETEDQRNWGDASFKTFCTPLDKPFPVLLKRGDKVFQRVTLKPVAALNPSEKTPSSVILRPGASATVLPALGIGASTEIPKLSDEAVSLIRALRLSHYRIDLFPASETFSSDFSSGYESAFAAGLPLEIALHLSGNYRDEIEAFTVICLQNKVRMKKVLLLSSDAVVTRQEVIEQVSVLRKTFPRVLFGAGTNYNFNELNKNRFDAAGLDFVSFAMDPQEHASDDLTILENAASLEYLIRSVKSIHGRQMAVHLSPLTLRKRYNPYATNPADFFIEESKKADWRQQETLGALWTFAAIAYLAKGGASAATLYQTAGNQGIISREGLPYPVYHVMQSLAQFQGKPVHCLESSDPLSVTALTLDDKIIAMVNYTMEHQNVEWEGRMYQLAPSEIKISSLNGS